MYVLIRVDVHQQIGTGHLYRCLNLANVLRRNDHHVIFIGRGIYNINFEVYGLPTFPFWSPTQDTDTWLGCSFKRDLELCVTFIRALSHKIDLLIVDHYSIDFRWEKGIKPFVDKVMVIDDLANREHHCDLLLDHTTYPIGSEPYVGLVSEGCKLLIGEKYVLLHPSFVNKNEKKVHKNGVRIQISFGGSDIKNQTLKVLKTLMMCLLNNQINQNVVIDVICGELYRYMNKLLEYIALIKCQKCKINVYQDISVKKMIKFIRLADFCLGAAGVSCYERCCLGTPTILITLAENQVNNAKFLADKKVGMYLGHYDCWMYDDFERSVMNYISDVDLVQEHGENGRQLVDGYGVYRIYNHINQLY